MDSNHGESDLVHLLQLTSHIYNHSLKFINPAALKCAVELDIPEIIHKHDQPMPLCDLISVLPIHPSKSKYVSRLMALLVHSGFFQLNDQQAYSLTPVSTLLVKDGPAYSTPIASFLTEPVVIKPFFELTNWFQSDDTTAFKTSFGEEFYEKCGKDPRLGRSFNEWVATDTKFLCKLVVNKCSKVFDGLKSLVDVGGNIGIMGKAIAEEFPGIECTVFDQPHVVAGLRDEGNLKFVGGSMFESIPPTDAILLKSVLMDWSEENCVKILKRCREAITSGGRSGKVMIIESVMVEMNWNIHEAVEAQLLVDVKLMSLLGGKERSESEWAKLFSEAGFSSYKIHPLLGLRSIIEVFP